MAGFDTQSLSLVGTTPYSAGRTISKYFYATGDALATVAASGYFNLATKRLGKGDVIEVAAVLDGTPAMATYIVTSATGAATVTVAIST